MHRWRIYYDNGSTYDYKSGDPNDAPMYGVIAIVQDDLDTGRNLVHRWDYYAYHNGEWYGHHLDGLLLELLYNANEVVAVKAGRTISNMEYQRILKLADHDPEFDPRSAKNMGEDGMERVK